MKDLLSGRMGKGGQTIACLLAVMFALSTGAFAVLGDNVRSVFSDQARMKGAIRIVQAQTYVVHEITAEKGTTVREFVAPSGTVFAVAWQGQFAPDLQQLLGPYYQQAQENLKEQRAQEQHRARGPLTVQTPTLVCESFGHQRSYQGRCYLPQQVPSGTPSSDIR